MGFLQFLVRVLAMIVLFVLGGILMLAGFMQFGLAGSMVLASKFTTEEAAQAAVFGNQVVGGTMGFIGLVMFIGAIYLMRRRH